MCQINHDEVLYEKNRHHMVYLLEPPWDPTYTAQSVTTGRDHWVFVKHTNVRDLKPR